MISPRISAHWGPLDTNEFPSAKPIPPPSVALLFRRFISPKLANTLLFSSSHIPPPPPSAVLLFTLRKPKLYRVDRRVPKIELYRPRIEHWGPKIELYRPRIEHWGPKIELYRPRIGHWGPKIERVSPIIVPHFCRT